MMPLASLPLLLIIAARPWRVSNRMSRPFVKALPQKLRTGPTKMDPLLFPASFRYRRDPTVALHFRRIGVTLPLRAKRRQQARRQHRPRSWQRLKDKKIRMRCRRRLLDLAVQIRNSPDQTSDHSRAHLHHCALGLDHRPIPNRRHRLPDSDQAALHQFGIVTALLAEERAQPRRWNLLQFLQRRPLLQQRTHQVRIQPVKPFQHLRYFSLRWTTLPRGASGIFLKEDRARANRRETNTKEGYRWPKHPFGTGWQSWRTSGGSWTGLCGIALTGNRRNSIAVEDGSLPEGGTSRISREV